MEAAVEPPAGGDDGMLSEGLCMCMVYSVVPTSSE